MTALHSRRTGVRSVFMVVVMAVAVLVGACTTTTPADTDSGTGRPSDTTTSAVTTAPLPPLSAPAPRKSTVTISASTARTEYTATSVTCDRANEVVNVTLEAPDGTVGAAQLSVRAAAERGTLEVAFTDAAGTRLAVTAAPRDPRRISGTGMFDETTIFELQLETEQPCPFLFR